MTELSCNDIRHINSIIVTGRCYKNGDIYYELTENDERELRGFEFKGLEYLHTVNYRDILTNKKYTRIKNSFFKLFINIKEQLK